MRTPQTIEKFWSFVQKTDSCWLWTRGKNRKGYGQYRYEKKLQITHRLAYRFAHGPIPDGMFVLHRCDNPPCVNPAHLWLGTNQDNMDDMNKKRRHGMANRTHCPQGHEYTEENTYIKRTGHRACRECGRQHCREFAPKRVFDREKIKAEYRKKRIAGGHIDPAIPKSERPCKRGHALVKASPASRQRSCNVCAMISYYERKLRRSPDDQRSAERLNRLLSEAVAGPTA